MNIKEFLSQAFYLDMSINSKLDQLNSLNDLATKSTNVINGMPHSPNKGVSRMADTVAKIVDLQCEVNADIDRLVELKRTIAHVIASVDKPDLRTILEKRYLCFQTWERIASEMQYDIRWLHRLHGKALVAADEALEKLA